jgi:RNA-directed DNA polymerase
MAKTVRNLWSSVVSWDNLLLAYNRCRRRKRYKRRATQFEHLAMDQLLQLQQDLAAETWQPGKYHHFQITDPKPRLISAAPFPDRVVHHAVVNVLEPIFERRFIFDSYACRKGKGTHRAIARAQHFLRRFPYYLKTDIVKFFPSVDHEIMLARLAKVIADPALLRLIGRIIDSGAGIHADEMAPAWFPGDQLLDAARPKGLPIGNLTSQFFANVLLDPVDHFIKEVLQVPGYVRYADDLLLFGATKQELWQVRESLQLRMNENRLRLHKHKTHVRPSSSGVLFLGLRVWPDQIRLSQQAIKRFNRRRRRMQHEFSNGQINCKTVQDSVRCWSAWAEQANASQIRKTLVRKIRLKRNSK